MYLFWCALTSIKYPVFKTLNAIFLYKHQMNSLHVFLIFAIVEHFYSILQDQFISNVNNALKNWKPAISWYSTSHWHFSQWVSNKVFTFHFQLPINNRLLAEYLLKYFLLKYFNSFDRGFIQKWSAIQNVVRQWRPPTITATQWPRQLGSYIRRTHIAPAPPVRPHNRHDAWPV